MTHDITNTDRENLGSLDAVYATLDITSLDSGGAEDFDPADELGISGVSRFGVGVRGQESSDYAITWDTGNAELSVVNVDDGSDVSSGTDVGEVILEVVGY